MFGGESAICALHGRAAVALCLVLCACDARREESPTWEGPAPSGPPPAPRSVNPAPLNNYASPGPLAEPRAKAGHAENRLVQVGRREAKAMLKPVARGGPRGEATLQQLGQAVQVELAVEHAPVGELTVATRDRGPCTEQPVPPGTASAPDVGGEEQAIAVGQDGKGQLRLTIQGATLEANDVESLLGEALVLYRPGGAEPLACG